MSSFIRLLAVLSHLLIDQSISPRLGIHSTGMKHEGIEKAQEAEHKHDWTQLLW